MGETAKWYGTEFAQTTLLVQFIGRKKGRRVVRITLGCSNRDKQNLIEQP